MKKGIKGLTEFSGKSNQTILPEFEKSKMHIIVEIIEDVPNTKVSRPTIKKTNVNIVAISFDTEELPEESSSFRYLYSDNTWRG